MPRMRFEPTIPAFERTKTVRALDRAATVIDLFITTLWILYILVLLISSGMVFRSRNWGDVSPKYQDFGFAPMILSRFRGDCRRGLDWRIDLLTTYIHHLELEGIAALSLISTLCKSPEQPLSVFIACCVFISRHLATALDSGDSSASRAQVLSSQPLMQNSTLNWQLPVN
jgi:hypothetical protein